MEDANILKLLLPAVDNVKEKVMEIKVSTKVSLKFINCSNTVSKGLLGGLSEKINATLFVYVKPWNASFKEVVCGGFALMRNLSTDDVGYKSVENGEIVDYGVVEARVSKAEDNNEDNGDALFVLLLICFVVYMFLF
ncbi:hypothetical protein CTI12_AA342560 [Artemisia annua]|uniref:Uncharacterized protein n=1 Tax=Artemisia annua TaxID=35608 RepID=A0A2U1MT99_ARTAN|nr:hypothetical protein CTI12_AA342560 [Artemisia annua]